MDLDKKTNPINKMAASYDIRLYDWQGNMKRQAYTKGGIVEFNVSNLPDGIYYIHIYDGINTKPETYKVIIKK